MRRRTSIRFDVAPSSGVPIYRQVMDQVMAEVAGGRLAAGDLLPSVRDVAGQLQVNPMTVSKAYSKLEAMGVVELVRGQGMRVAAPAVTGSPAERQAQLRPLVEQMVNRAYQLGLSAGQVRALIDPLLKELGDE